MLLFLGHDCLAHGDVNSSAKSVIDESPCTLARYTQKSDPEGIRKRGMVLEQEGQASGSPRSEQLCNGSGRATS